MILINDKEVQLNMACSIWDVYLVRHFTKTFNKSQKYLIELEKKIYSISIEISFDLMDNFFAIC